jgi:hypothetical protein
MLGGEGDGIEVKRIAGSGNHRKLIIGIPVRDAAGGDACRGGSCRRTFVKIPGSDVLCVRLLGSGEDQQGED